MVTCSAGKNQSGWLGSGGHIHSQAIGVMLGQAEKGLHSVQLAVSETKMVAVLEGLRGESSIADICHKHQISESL